MMLTIITTGTLDETGVPTGTRVTLPKWVAELHLANGVAKLAEEPAATDTEPSTTKEDKAPAKAKKK